MYLVTSLAELLIKLLLPCVINYSSLEELWWKIYIYLIDLLFWLFTWYNILLELS